MGPPEPPRGGGCSDPPAGPIKRKTSVPKAPLDRDQPVIEQNAKEIFLLPFLKKI